MKIYRAKFLEESSYAGEYYRTLHTSEWYTDKELAKQHVEELEQLREKIILCNEELRDKDEFAYDEHLVCWNVVIETMEVYENLQQIKKITL